jgi:hypothetical protein
MASGEQSGNNQESQAVAAFSGMNHDDPLFLELKQLLLLGKRSEAIRLIQSKMSLDTPEAQELTKLIMGTLQDTMIDP